jgi:hypothetical protein
MGMGNALGSLNLFLSLSLVFSSNNPSLLRTDITRNAGSKQHPPGFATTINVGSRLVPSPSAIVLVSRRTQVCYFIRLSLCLLDSFIQQLSYITSLLHFVTPSHMASNSVSDGFRDLTVGSHTFV